jgi:hypothetical protein
MISPHTPPGTKVVCIDASGTEIHDGVTPCPLVEGAVYTLAQIEMWEGRLFALVVEIGDREAFALRRFRRLDLPESLTKLLNVQPTDLEVVE